MISAARPVKDNMLNSARKAVRLPNILVVGISQYMLTHTTQNCSRYLGPSSAILTPTLTTVGCQHLHQRRAELGHELKLHPPKTSSSYGSKSLGFRAPARRRPALSQARSIEQPLLVAAPRMSAALAEIAHKFDHLESGTPSQKPVEMIGPQITHRICEVQSLLQRLSLLASFANVAH
jgi:hypothetical protein